MKALFHYNEKAEVSLSCLKSEHAFENLISSPLRSSRYNKKCSSIEHSQSAYAIMCISLNMLKRHKIWSLQDKISIWCFSHKSLQAKVYLFLFSFSYANKSSWIDYHVMKWTFWRRKEENLYRLRRRLNSNSMLNIFLVLSLSLELLQPPIEFILLRVVFCGEKLGFRKEIVFVGIEENSYLVVN